MRRKQELTVKAGRAVAVEIGFGKDDLKPSRR
jgi:hypothetical protein